MLRDKVGGPDPPSLLTPEHADAREVRPEQHCALIRLFVLSSC